MYEDLAKWIAEALGALNRLHQATAHLYGVAYVGMGDIEVQMEDEVIGFLYEEGDVWFFDEERPSRPPEASALVSAVPSRDYGREAQKAAETHLAACDDWQWWVENEEPDDDAPLEPSTAGPYCGCDTCRVRETLWAAWSVINEYIDDAGCARLPVPRGVTCR